MHAHECPVCTSGPAESQDKAVVGGFAHGHERRAVRGLDLTLAHTLFALKVC